jgi:hypothetical protein
MMTGLESASFIPSSAGLTPSSVKAQRASLAQSLSIGQVDEKNLVRLLEYDSQVHGLNINVNTLSSYAQRLHSRVISDTFLPEFIGTYIKRQDPFFSRPSADREHLLYTPISVVFNSVSLMAADILDSSTVLKCIPHHTNSPKSSEDIDDHSDTGKPDLLILKSSESDVEATLVAQRDLVHQCGLNSMHPFSSITGPSRMHWATVVGFAEVKTTTAKIDERTPQEYPYCFSHWGNRPSLYRILYICASTTHYDIKRVDANCALESRSPWLDETQTPPRFLSYAFCLYVTSLYLEQEDTRFKREERGEDNCILFEPKEGITYQLKTIFRQPSSRRRTHVFIGEKQIGPSTSPALIAIKISWKDVKNKRDETQILKHIHQAGPFIPSVRLHGEFLDTRTITTLPPEKVELGEGFTLSTRERKVIIMSTVGYPLNSCDSLLKILMVLYDTVECEYP